MGRRLLVDGYLFDLSAVVGGLQGRGATLLLEAPEGFLQYLPGIAELLEEEGFNTVARLDPAYGGCDVGCAYAARVGADAVVHVGHTRYPLLRTEGCRVFYVPGEYVEAHERVEEYAEAVASRLGGGGVVAIAYTAQHRMLAEMMERLLRSRGVRVAARRPILGCYHYGLDLVEVDYYVVVAGGLFHALGLALRLGSPDKVLPLDPYLSSPVGEERLRRIYSRVIARRLWIVSEASRGRRFAVIDGAKPGQHRPGVVKRLVELGRRRGVRVDVYVSDTLRRDYLLDLRPGEYDAYVVASCPRIPIEDYTGSEHPVVLTPGEFVMAMEGRLERYIFPW